MRDAARFLKTTLYRPFKKVVLPERVKCGGMEGEIVVVHGCRKRKRLICGPEGEIVVAHGRLPSPAPITYNVLSLIAFFPSFNKSLILPLRNSGGDAPKARIKTTCATLKFLLYHDQLLLYPETTLPSTTNNLNCFNFLKSTGRRDAITDSNLNLN